jgi:hypothetical protein
MGGRCSAVGWLFLGWSVAACGGDSANGGSGAPAGSSGAATDAGGTASGGDGASGGQSAGQGGAPANAGGAGSSNRDRVRPSSRVLNGHVLGFTALVLLLACGGTAAPGASAGAGGVAQGASGASVSGAPPASAGASASGAPARGGAGGNSPASSEGGAFESGGAAPGGAPLSGSGGLTQGGASSEPTLEPVRVIRGDSLEDGWQDLTIRGVALHDYEGKVVTVRLGKPDRAPERLGSGQVRVEAGAFELFFPGVWESSLYKSKLVYMLKAALRS